MNSNLAPEIFRKRLILEGKYTKNIDNEKFVSDFLVDLSREMDMTVIHGPFISSATGKAAPIHEGYEGVLVWAESGANTYIWTKFKFFTVDVYSCKDFDSLKAIDFIKERFGVSEFSYYEIPDPNIKSDSRVELRSTDNKGVGLFAKDFIPAHTIISYVDGQIHYAEKESLVYEHAKDHAIPFSKYFYRNGFNTHAVKLNHSCNPNCYVKDLFFIKTIRDISPGEELTYCYGLFCNSDWTNPENKCFCGSVGCLGKILPWRDLPYDFKKEHVNHTADWILFEEIKKKDLVQNILERLEEEKDAKIKNAKELGEFFEIKDTINKGLGLFAKKDFEIDENLFEFTGEIYEADFAKDLTDEIKDHGVGVFENRWIWDRGNYAYYINHSCDSNCGMNGLTKVVARKKIKAGDELTIDYALFEDCDWVLEGCLCGENLCRNSPGRFREMPDHIRKMYGKYISPWLVEKYKQ